MGYSDQRITIGAADSYNASLQPGNELEEVVVTSLGIKREKQALWYAISESNPSEGIKEYYLGGLEDFFEEEML